jgi:hypothetical protein
MAEIKFYSDLSLQGGASINNLRVENLPTASIPATGVDGQMVFDTDLNVLKFWDGTEWAAIQNDADLQDAIDDLDGRLDTIENAPYATEGFVTGLTDDLDGRLDTIEAAPYATEGFVTGLTDDLDGRLDTIEAAPYATEGFVTGLTDDLDGRLDTIENAPYATEGFVTGLTDDLDGRLDTIENAPYATEGFVTGLTDDLDGRLDAIESAPYASEAYADQAAANAADAHNLDTDAHPMGIKWFTPTALVNGPITYPGAPQSGVSLTTGGISVSSLGGSDPLAWLEFEGQITVSGTGSVTLDVDIDAELYGVVAMPQLTLNRGEATAFRYMVQAPVTGVAQEYDLIFKTISGTETADFSPISIDAFGSDPFVVQSTLDAVDDRVTAIESAPYSYRLDFTVTGDAVETEFTSAPFAGEIYPAVSVWEDATGSLVLVDVARAYSAGPDTTTLTISFNEAPADGATYRVAVKA